MLCNIAELITEVPAAGGMTSRCREYLAQTERKPDIVIDERYYQLDAWEALSENDAVYMESGRQFYWHLLRHEGLMLHASAVGLDGRAYLFSGPCGRGKSTHTRLWQAVFGAEAVVFNDDKPALRRLGGRWYAYGTPWCGKDGINQNRKFPLAGICFLQKGEENRIRRLTAAEALPLALAQTTYRLLPEGMELLLGHLDRLLREIPVFELTNKPEPGAARLSCETMRRAALEEGL